jgi:YggT family protein
MSASFVQAITFIIDAIARLYILVLLLRLVLPWVRADFRNPLAQAILRLTSPLVVPLRRIVPPIGRVDTATVLIAYVIQYLTLVVIILIHGRTPQFAPVALLAIVELVILTVNLFVFAILIRVILSWVAPGTYNPATAMITTLTEPVLRPFRRMLPSMGGLDLSPLFAMIILVALTILLGGLKS